MHNQKAIILWVAGFAGVVLLYSAFKGKSPLTTIKTSLAGATPASGGGGGGGSGVSVIDRPTEGIAAAAGSLAGGIGSDNGLYYQTDAYGNLIAPLPLVYQHSPNSYIAPNTVGA